MERQKTTLAAYNELYKEQDDLYRGAARGFGLSDCAFWVLYALRETKRPMTQSGICAAVYQPKQTVHSALKKLEGEGYLRLAEGRDRRSKHLVLTERGEALVRRTVDPVMAAEEAAMDRRSRHSFWRCSAAITPPCGNTCPRRGSGKREQNEE